MNTQITVHPRLHHYGLMTANLDAMVDWYRQVLGMTVNLFVTIPSNHPGANPPEYFSGVATSVTWAIFHGGLWLTLHALLGLVIVIAGVGTLVRAIRLGGRGRITLAALARGDAPVWAPSIEANCVGSVDAGAGVVDAGAVVGPGSSWVWIWASVGSFSCVWLLPLCVDCAGSVPS